MRNEVLQSFRSVRIARERRGRGRELKARLRIPINLSISPPEGWGQYFIQESSVTYLSPTSLAEGGKL
jgi:hypothetical protein